MQSLPSDLYECASLDGANGIQKFRKLTVPLLANTTFFITITSIISSFQVFGYINVMTGDVYKRQDLHRCEIWIGRLYHVRQGERRNPGRDPGRA